MGRCSAFNFGPKELKEKMKNFKYFVYSPNFESALDQLQSFYTNLSLSNTNYTYFVEELRKALNLKSMTGDKFDFLANLTCSFFYNGEENTLFLSFESKEYIGAITQEQIDVLGEIDQQLAKANFIPAKIERAQDVVFGENHLLAKELSKPFKSKAGVYVPSQKEWFFGKSYEEVRQRHLESEKR